jgi:hypothetical protein
MVLLRPPPAAAATAEAGQRASSEPLLSSGGCGAGVAMRKVNFIFLYFAPWVLFSHEEIVF